jgi:uncharacterized protein
MSISANHPEKWREDVNYLRGIQLFNAHQFWESHEAWEEIWLICDGIQAEFLQGLIQAAAALLKYQRNEFPPALRLYNTATGRLSLCPDRYMGVDVREFQRVLADCFSSVLSGKSEPLITAKIPVLKPI